MFTLNSLIYELKKTAILIAQVLGRFSGYVDFGEIDELPSCA